MALQTVTLRLPETVIRFAEQAADALQRPVEDVLASMLVAAAPDVSDVPQELRAEIARMTFLSDRDLWQIAQGSMKSSSERQMAKLLKAQGERELTDSEQARLEALRGEYGRVTVLKARAYALLSLRSGLPLLSPS
jgi:hypothetical protein